MVRLATISLLLLAAATFSDAAAQSRLHLTPVGDGVKHVTSGAVATALFRAENSGADTLDASFSIVLPDGWTVAGRPAPLHLAPGASRSVLVAYKPSHRALPDTTAISLVALAADGDTLASAQAGVQVGAVRRLQASVLASPQAAPVQAAHTVRFAVTNDGNVRQAIDLTVTSSLGFKVEASPSRLQLAPFTSAEIVAVVTPDPRIDGRHRNLLQLTATGDGTGSERPEARAQAETVVMRRGRSQAARGRTIPVRLGVSAQSLDGSTAGQVDFSASEWMLAGGTASVTVRGPRPVRSGLFASQDFYQATYERGGLDIRLGDQYVRQTELVTQGAPGFGLRIAAPIGRLEAAAYALRSRYGFPRRDRQGVSVGLPLSTTWRVGLEAAAERWLAPAYAASFTTDWTPSRTSGVHFEAGAGSYGGEVGTGLSTQVRYAASGRRIDLRYQRATAGFPGTFRGTTRFNGSATLDLGRRIAADAQFHSTRRAYDFGASAPTGQDFARIGLGGSLRLPLGFTLQSGAAISGRTHTSPAQGIDRREAAVSANAALSHSRVGVRYAIEAGSLDSGALTDRFRRNDLTFYFRSSRFALNVSASVDEGPRVYFPVDARRRQLGSNVSVRLSGNLRADLQYYFSESSAPYMFRMHLGEAELEYRLPFGHEIAIRTRMVVSDGGYRVSRDMAGGIAYRVPLDVPTGGRASGVHGKVLFADTGHPVRDAIVTLGEQTVLTDEQGRFWFARRGDGRMLVDPSLVDPGMVVMNPEALLFPESGDFTVEIFLTRGSSVSGSFVLEDQATIGVVADAVTQDDLATRGLTVVLSNGTEERLAMTGVDGSFRLTGLPPGTWQVKADPTTLPAGFRVSDRAVEVSVEPGTAVDVRIPVGRRSRAVRMVGSASLSLAAPARQTTNPIAPDAARGERSAAPTTPSPERETRPAPDRDAAAGTESSTDPRPLDGPTDSRPTDLPGSTERARPEASNIPELRDTADLAPAAALPSYTPNADLAPGRDRRLAGLALLLALAAALVFLRLGLRARRVRVRRVRHAVIHRPSRMRLVAGPRKPLRPTGTHGSADPP